MNKEYDVVFYFKSINSIGGVESFFYYLSQKYKNIVVYYREGDTTQVNRLAKYVEVHKYKNEKIKCNKQAMKLSSIAINMKYFKGKIEAYTYVYNLLKEMKQ